MTFSVKIVLALVCAAASLVASDVVITRGMGWLVSHTVLIAARLFADVEPAFLRMPRYRRCVDSRSDGKEMQWCLPTSRPHDCDHDSWLRLRDPTPLLPSCDTIVIVIIPGSDSHGHDNQHHDSHDNHHHDNHHDNHHQDNHHDGMQHS
jgi:hypothetical protein